MDADRTELLGRILAEGDRRKRRRLLAGGGLATVVVALVAGAALAWPGDRRDADQITVADDPTTTTEAERTTTSSSTTTSTTAAPTPTSTAVADPPAPADTTVPTATPTTTAPAPPAGWSSGFTGCSVREPGPSTAPGEGLTIRLDVPDPIVAPGEQIAGTLIVTNDGAEPASFTIVDNGEDDGTLIDPSGRAVSARFWTDTFTSRQVQVEPGSSTAVAITIRTDTCGQEVGEFEPLPPGDYAAMAALRWDGDGTWPVWWSEPIPVTLAA